jgi:hypothetical protein
MVRYRHCDSSIWQSALHNDMAPATPDFHKAVFCKYSANLLTGNDSKLTQLPPLLVLCRFHYEDALLFPQEKQFQRIAQVLRGD